MNMGVLARRAIGLALGIVAVAGGTAQAATTTPVDTSMCSDPLLSQPFASAHDNSWYTLAPGESADNFDAAGWQLTGGARIITTTLADGSVGSVLDLPSGATAVSPTMCVTSQYPVARAMVQDVVGAEGVFFYVSYEGTKTWNTPKNTGQVHGNKTNWTLAAPVNVQPAGAPGWQPVRFTFVAGGKNSDFRLYDFYVDPHCRS
ncbi:MAG TPA: hypothetical protein VMJ65_20665 [Solirubrobacteraceae bacterium]|nr:hypothetical protein [Solirubrobacteraceae bacterium]